MGVMMLKPNLLMLLFSESTCLEETSLSTWNNSKTTQKDTRNNSPNTKLMVLMLLDWKLFMKVYTRLSVLLLLLSRRLHLFLKVKNQRATRNKDFHMLKERTEFAKNSLLPKRKDKQQNKSFNK